MNGWLLIVLLLNKVINIICPNKTKVAPSMQVACQNDRKKTRLRSITFPPISRRKFKKHNDTKVTADGEPHEMMTLIAGLSGVVAAIVILIVLVSLVACKKDRNEPNCKKCPAGLPAKQCIQRRSRSQSKSSANTERTSISTISSQQISPLPTPEPQMTMDVEIGNGNLKGNLNAAFEGSQLNLANSLKPKKKTRWYDEVIANGLAKETVIDMQER